DAHAGHLRLDAGDLVRLRMTTHDAVAEPADEPRGRHLVRAPRVRYPRATHEGQIQADIVVADPVYMAAHGDVRLGGAQVDVPEDEPPGRHLGGAPRVRYPGATAEGQIQGDLVVADPVYMAEQVGVGLGVTRVDLQEVHRVGQGLPEELDVEGHPLETDRLDD